MSRYLSQDPGNIHQKEQKNEPNLMPLDLSSNILKGTEYKLTSVLEY